MNNIKNKKCNINNNYLDDNNSFIKAVNIKKYFRMSSKKCLRAVDDVSLDIKQNQIVSLIGESGSGKSTFGKTLIRLYEPTSGEIFVENKNITHAKLIPHKKIQMIFQNPLFSLNPRMTIGEIIQEPLDIYKIFDNDKEKKERVSFLLESVGLNAKYVNRYPHEFSGGQQQRICIARALAVEPKFIVCDEPTSALDISVQSQIINMLKDIQVRLKLSYLFISHDISIAKYISDVIAVMYLGNILELMSSKELENNSLHPYTKILIASEPIPDPRLNKNSMSNLFFESIESNESDLSNGCKFYSRCPYKKSACKIIKPVLHEVSTNHFVACNMF